MTNKYKKQTNIIISLFFAFFLVILIFLNMQDEQTTIVLEEVNEITNTATETEILPECNKFNILNIDKNLTIDDRQRWEINVNFLPKYSYVIHESHVTISWIEADYPPTTIYSDSTGHWKLFPKDDQVLIVEQRAYGLEKMRVMIDPGHGDHEHGTYGRQSGALEKDIVLEISKLLKNELTARDVTVQLTRSDDSLLYNEYPFDVGLDLFARVEIATKFEPDVFISIHTDNYPTNLSVRGTTSFYYESFDEQLANESRVLAEKIGSSVANALDTRWRGANANDYKVIKHNLFPAILLEVAFLSNRSDESKLLNHNYQLAIAQAIADSLQDIYD